MGTSETPPFWWQKPDWRSFALAPAAAVYANATRIRLSRPAKVEVDLPILRVGDFAVAVPGKTQAAMAFARAARKFGHKPGLICQAPSGFGSQPHRVDRTHDSARHVGEAAFEMAAAAPTIICSDRAAGARMLAAEGCDFLFAVDGLTAWPLRTHYTVLVVDAGRGLGNERVIPAGPLRGSLTDHVRSADAVLRIGGGQGGNSAVRAAARAARPVYEARVAYQDGESLAGKKVILFSAIKDPETFFQAVAEFDADILATHVLAEGRLPLPDQLGEMVSLAEQEKALIVTTRRDLIRLEDADLMPDGAKSRLMALDMTVEFEVQENARTMIEETIAEWRRGRSR